MIRTADFDCGKYDCAGEGQGQFRKQTHALVREGASHEQTRDHLTVTNIWFWAPDAV
jgi:hypothetical protein